MKSNFQRKVFRMAVFLAALLATCMFARGANAQFSAFEGKFTLPYETHWGKAVLPAGDYVLTFTNDNTQPKLMIRDAKGLLIVAYERTDVRDDSTKGPSALVIGTQGTRRAVQSLRIAELGETFVYERPPAQGRSMEEAVKTQAVPVVIAKK
jgi:hypothetical protein